MALTGSSALSLVASPAVSPYSQMTMALWVKPAGTNTNALFALTGNPSGYVFNIHTAGNPPNVMGSQCSSNNGTTIDGTGVGGASIAGAWHFLLTTFDNGGVTGTVVTVKPYLDGVLNNTVTAGGPVTALQNNDPVSTGYLFTGASDGGATIAYPMVWKRLLSQAEITALAAKADPRSVAPANLVIFASLNQATGTIADLATPSIQWVVTGGTFTVAADPFTLGSATAPGTPVAAGASIDSLFSAIFPTRNTALAATPTYIWSDPNTVQGSWPDGSVMTAKFEARPLAPNVLTR